MSMNILLENSWKYKCCLLGWNRRIAVKSPKCSLYSVLRCIYRHCSYHIIYTDFSVKKKSENVSGSLLVILDQSFSSCILSVGSRLSKKNYLESQFNSEEMFWMNFRTKDGRWSRCIQSYGESDRSGTRSRTCNGISRRLWPRIGSTLKIYLWNCYTRFLLKYTFFIYEIISCCSVMEWNKFCCLSGCFAFIITIRCEKYLISSEQIWTAKSSQGCMIETTSVQMRLLTKCQMCERCGTASLAQGQQMTALFSGIT